MSITSPLSAMPHLPAFCAATEAFWPRITPTIHLRSSVSNCAQYIYFCLKNSVFFYKSAERTATAKLHASRSSGFSSVEASSTPRSSPTWRQPFFRLPFLGWAEMAEPMELVILHLRLSAVCHCYAIHEMDGWISSNDFLLRFFCWSMCWSSSMHCL